MEMFTIQERHKPQTVKQSPNGMALEAQQLTLMKTQVVLAITANLFSKPVLQQTLITIPLSLLMELSVSD
jgi:hypothetical protein